MEIAIKWLEMRRDTLARSRRDGCCAPSSTVFIPPDVPLSRSRLHVTMASVTTSLALGAKQAVRGAKVASKRTVAPKAVNVTAKAQISKGARPPSIGDSRA